MNTNYVSELLLDDLLKELKYPTVPYVRKEVKKLINADLDAGSTYPDDVAKEIVASLEIDESYEPIIIDVLKPLYQKFDAPDFGYFED